MKIEVIRFFFDSELNKGCKIGEEIDVTKKHGELLVASGYGIEKKEVVKKQTSKSPEKE